MKTGGAWGNEWRADGCVKLLLTSFIITLSYENWVVVCLALMCKSNCFQTYAYSHAPHMPTWEACVGPVPSIVRICNFGRLAMDNNDIDIVFPREFLHQLPNRVPPKIHRRKSSLPTEISFYSNLPFTQKPSHLHVNGPNLDRPDSSHLALRSTNGDLR